MRNLLIQPLRAYESYSNRGYFHRGTLTIQSDSPAYTESSYCARHIDMLKLLKSKLRAMMLRFIFVNLLQLFAADVVRWKTGREGGRNQGVRSCGACSVHHDGNGGPNFSLVHQQPTCITSTVKSQLKYHIRGAKGLPIILPMIGEGCVASDPTSFAIVCWLLWQW